MTSIGSPLNRRWLQYKRLSQLSFPPSFPLVQFPNAPLIVALVAGVVAKETHGSTHDYAAALSYMGLTIWAYEELAKGVNWFRRLLGLTFMVLIVLRIGHGLGA